MYLSIVQVLHPSDPDKYSTIIPLSMVLSFTACKEIYEDMVTLKYICVT